MSELYFNALNYASELAFHGQRTKKADLQQLIEEIAECAERGEVPTYKQLGAIYSALIPPTKITKPKTPFEWVAMAVADNKDTRQYLRYVWVSEGRIVGCDGHRLHVAPNEEASALAPGFYYPDGRPATVDAKYSDIMRIRPNNPDIATPVEPLSLRPINYKNAKYGTAAILAVDDEGNPQYRVNAKYLSAALVGLTNPIALRADNSGPMRIDSDNGCWAVIMPISI